MFLPPEANFFYTFVLIFIFCYGKRCISNGFVDLKPENFPDIYFFETQGTFWNPRKISETQGIFLKIQKIPLKT